MFIIRSKTRPHLARMKTPLGDPFVGFAEERHGQAYLKAVGLDALMEVVSRDVLLEQDPHAFDTANAVLLLPSLDAVRDLLRDAHSFPYERYVVNAFSVP